MESTSAVAASYLSSHGRSAHHSHIPAHGADPNTLINQFANMGLGSMNMPSGAGPVPMGPGHAFMMGSDGQFVLAPMPSAGQHLGMGHGSDGHYQGFSMPPGGYAAPYVGVPLPIMPYTPGRAAATAHPRVERGQSDVPGLENRRGSYSTTESTPATPFYGAVSQRDNGPRVASLDRSAYTTPSPQQIGLPSLHAEAPKSTFSAVSEAALDELLKKEPAIPKAVPAVFTPPNQMKSIDQSLDNRIPGNRNVYIRGLHPTTDDELLFHFASRFGAVETSKAIIDTGTGACKGYVISLSIQFVQDTYIIAPRFGFAKFFEAQDSEMCIRGFHKLGYEVGFARVRLIYQQILPHK